MQKSFINKFTFIYIFFWFLLLVTPAYSLNYEFSEDFNQNNFSDWNFMKVTQDGVRMTTSSAHEFSTNEGYLISQGSYRSSVSNIAVHDMNTTFGVWQFDINYPNERVVNEFDWYIVLSDNFFGGFEEDADEYQLTQRTRNGTLISLSQGRIEVVNEVTGNSGIPKEINLENSVPSELWIHYDFVKTPDRIMIFVDDNLISNVTYTDNVSQYGTLAFMSNIGSQVKFDNIQISPDYEVFIESKENEGKQNGSSVYIVYLISIITISSILGISYKFYKSSQARKIIEMAHQSSTNPVSEQIYPLFNNQSKLYYLLLGQTVKNEKDEQRDLEDLIPQKIYQYRFLLHPYRLAIMKLLDQYYKLSSVEIKERLGLSWGEYSNIIKSLKKRGYVSLSDDFEDSSVRRFVFITDTGTQDFRTLKDLLDGLLFDASDIFDEDKYDTLYPS